MAITGSKTLASGSQWEYKGKQYRIVRFDRILLTQDYLGEWVGTVIYEAEGIPDLTFARPYTEFFNKFTPRFS